MTKLTANLILLGMFGTWCYLSIVAGHMIAVSNDFLVICGILVTGNVGDAFAGKWQGGTKQAPKNPVA